MIHCLSNVEKELEGVSDSAGLITSAALYTSVGDAHPWVFGSLLIRQKYSKQTQQWHKPSSFPVNCWHIWCTAFTTMGKTSPSTHHLDINHCTVPCSILCRHHLCAICIFLQYKVLLASSLCILITEVTIQNSYSVLLSAKLIFIFFIQRAPKA